jgi:AcrR family transcriptional regulator
MDLVTEQKLERRERILAGARELISERGYAGLTMRDLAAHCRVSVPTLYNQFGGKDALLASAVESHFTGLLDAVREGSGQRGHARVLAVVAACAEEQARLPRYHRALLLAFMRARETASLQASLVAELASELECGLDEMKAGRQLAAWVSSPVLARAITTACIAASTIWLTGELDDDMLRAAMLHAASTMVLGCARGSAREALESAARLSQRALEPEVANAATA